MLTPCIWSFRSYSSAVLVDENSVVYAIQEEKLSRSTGMGGIPRLAIARCLQQRNAQITDVQLAAFPRRLSISSLREARFRLQRTLSCSGAAWTHSLGRNFREAAQLRQTRRLYAASTPFLFFEHHLCHAASAYYASPFERALVLTLDESGDMRSGSLYLGEGGELRLLQPLRFPNSLGWFYSRVTQLLGLRARRDEHKVQWLSKDGKPDFAPAFRKIFQWNSNGLPVLNTRYFGREPEEATAFAVEFFRDSKLDPQVVAADPRWRASLARSARDVLEEIVLAIAERYRTQQSVDCLCVDAGLFLIVFPVAALRPRVPAQHAYEHPVHGNSVAPLGAALLARKSLGCPARQSLPHLYLGPGFSSSEIKSVLDNCKVIYKNPSGDVPP